MQHKVIKTKITIACDILLIYMYELLHMCVSVYIILGNSPKMRHACEMRAMARRTQTHTHTHKEEANPSISA